MNNTVTQRGTKDASAGGMAAGVSKFELIGSPSGGTDGIFLEALSTSGRAKSILCKGELARTCSPFGYNRGGQPAAWSEVPRHSAPLPPNCLYDIPHHS